MAKKRLMGGYVPLSIKEENRSETSGFLHFGSIFAILSTRKTLAVWKYGLSAFFVDSASACAGQGTKRSADAACKGEKFYPTRRAGACPRRIRVVLTLPSPLGKARRARRGLPCEKFYPTCRDRRPRLSVPTPNQHKNGGDKPPPLKTLRYRFSVRGWSPRRGKRGQPRQN